MSTEGHQLSLQYSYLHPIQANSSNDHLIKKKKLKKISRGKLLNIKITVHFLESVQNTC